jgi:hypothetical protein
MSRSPMAGGGGGATALSSQAGASGGETSHGATAQRQGRRVRMWIEGGTVTESLPRLGSIPGTGQPVAPWIHRDSERTAPAHRLRIGS